ncbi:hypothetical protein N8H74_26390 [Pseudomonas sp. B2M1-30]|uniref:hypothetical protein n=1 Tax=Pseudomonas TaxID=286 RepID=UPI0021C8B955|nr:MULTISPECIES: hypothetical protein [Pseudomonas]MCU0121804.1 hypothetical protein [Pseudomonas sp. B2M1-30]MCU7264504.1 hypothetical protein [Pseudomonas koreensis]
MLNDYGKSLFKPIVSAQNIILGLAVFFVLVLFFRLVSLNSNELASWVQAFGSIAAILAAVWIAGRESRLRKTTEAQERVEAMIRVVNVVEHTAIAAKNALEAITANGNLPDLVSGMQFEFSLRQQYLKEMVSSRGIDSKMYHQLFLVRNAVDDFALTFHVIANREKFDVAVLEGAWVAMAKIENALRTLQNLQQALENADEPPRNAEVHKVTGMDSEVVTYTRYSFKGVQIVITGSNIKTSNHLVGWLPQAQELERKAEWNAVIASCTRMIEGVPEYYAPYILRANAYAATGRKQEAEADLLFVVNSVGNDPEYSVFASMLTDIRSGNYPRQR